MKYIKSHKLFESSEDELYCYHGTDLYTENGEDFNKPLWVSKDIDLARHFGLRPSSSSKKVDVGYVYKLKVSNPVYKVIDNRRLLLESGDIEILQIDTIVPDAITYAKTIKSTNVTIHRN